MNQSKTVDAVEAPVISGHQKIQNIGFCWECPADHLLGCQWPILVHFQEKGQTVTAARYSDMLVNKLKPTIWLKCQGLLSKKELLLHDNARPHMAVHTVDIQGIQLKSGPHFNISN
jgi:hypothetical protein